ncbi:hypothetical protein QTH87_07925 [Variovorax sp. J22P168]|nr:hypothetical protein [Variovorax sp. J22P168]MDM0012360.1 hypothetical protein [Variovorax sp. J22P168]
MHWPAAAAPGLPYRELITSPETLMKSIILWLCGVPLVVIIGLKVFGIL